MPVPITENQTQAGHSSQIVRAQRLRQTPNMTTPTMNASIEWSDGIAAYGLEVEAITRAPVVDARVPASVSTKPQAGNIRGGAVGTST